jgi:rSAM/selenodomain-associated transferase 2/rSAM/selenodomain-associated transferase 1
MQRRLLRHSRWCILNTETTRNSQALMIFLRYPEPGRVKTRLAAGIGRQEATWLYEKLVWRTLGVAADLRRSRPGVDLIIFFHPPEQESRIRAKYPGPWNFVAQAHGHLGEKMAAAFHHARDHGYHQAVLIGSDIGDLALTDLQSAFGFLEPGRAVLGPAADGGFYLIGLGGPCAGAFTSSEWGTAEVFQRTSNALPAAGWGVKILERRHDIDRIEDLVQLPQRSYFEQRLSVIVPTVKPIDAIEPLVAALEPQLWPGDEIIVVRGRHPLGQEMVVLSPQAQVISTARGRGRQLNCGARAARGDLFWFFHDDCTPPPNFGYHVRKLTHAPHAVLGCFQLAFTPTNRALDLIVRWANFRTRRLMLPYGDQGIFCRRETFEQVGGFRKAFLMEDVDFVRSVRKLGALLPIPENLHTSPQRYLSHGILCTSLRNHLLMTLYLLGVDDRKLHAIYYHHH